MTNKSSRKYCGQCGAPNKRTAKVCVQCGHHFLAARETLVAPLRETEKSCPHCGTVNKLAAKVCIQCGHRFRSKVAQTPQIPSSEPPIVQNPVPPLALPQEFNAPSIPAHLRASDILPDGNLTGEPAPDISRDDLNKLREQSAENTTPYEQIQRLLQRKLQKP